MIDVNKTQIEFQFLQKKKELRPKGKNKKKQLSREDTSFILGIKEPIKEAKSADTKPE